MTKKVFQATERQLKYTTLSKTKVMLKQKIVKMKLKHKHKTNNCQDKEKKRNIQTLKLKLVKQKTERNAKKYIKFIAVLR